jgi:hypothetical protein
MEPAVVKRPSPKQLSRLRNGHSVRVCPAIEGEGMNLLVNPARLNQMTRSFDKGKGIMVALSPEEIAANREIGGEGIFGKQFDKLLKKGGIKKGAFAAAEALKPVVKQAIKEGVKNVPPKYRPAAEAAAAMATKYMDDPDKYQSAKGAAELAKVGAKEGGTKFAKQQLKERMAAMKKPTTATPAPTGGKGLYLGARGRGVGTGGNLLSVHNSILPPAMQSQNASANFHFSTQLPPQLAAIKMSGGGLYL